MSDTTLVSEVLGKPNILLSSYGELLMKVKDWIDKFENFTLLYYDDIKKNRKVVLLKICIGDEAERYLKLFEEYDTIISDIRSWQIKNVLRKRYEFLSVSQEPNIRFCTYITPLIKDYNATEYTNDSIRLDVFIKVCYCNTLKSKLLIEEKLTWDRARKICLNYEIINKQQVNYISKYHLASFTNCLGRNIKWFKCSRIDHFSKRCNPNLQKKKLDIEIIVDTGSEVSLLPKSFLNSQPIINSHCKLISFSGHIICQQEAWITKCKY
ncbi:hypothetical protein A3Q56_07039 [Intoshia linei]|uniref:Uncharacterized protein n=1 Tax=Intoshia linei TaxID=1819745 RepID=A0A177AT46_9BILA|nr:hypothetical protein A3Q56_07039 [Intoshia linei]